MNKITINIFFGDRDGDSVSVAIEQGVPGTAREPKVGDRVRILPGATSSNPAKWATPPAGALATVDEEVDSSGDVCVRADVPFDTDDPRTGWVKRDGFEYV